MLLGISLGALLVCLCMLCNRRIERLAAPFVCGLMLLEYLLALFGRLEWLMWIAPTCALGALAVLLVRLVKGRGKMLKAGVGCVLTPGLLCLAALAVLFHAGSQGLFVNAADDIHYWAIEVRSLYAHGGLVDARHHLSPNFMNYTPGMALYQWTAMAVLGEWNEPALFAMLWLFYAVMLLPHFEWVTWKRAGWVVLEGLLVIAVPAALGSDAFTMLRVDSALGLCLGYALTQAWYACREQAGRGERLCCFALALCALILIKLSGVAWALVALGLMLAVRSLSPHPLRLRAALFAGMYRYSSIGCQMRLSSRSSSAVPTACSVCRKLTPQAASSLYLRTIRRSTRSQFSRLVPIRITRNRSRPYWVNTSPRRRLQLIAVFSFGAAWAAFCASSSTCP